MTWSLRSAAAGLALSTGLMIAGGASAAPIAYQGTLADGIASFGAEPKAGNRRTPDSSLSSYWSFWGEAGDVVTLQVDRLTFSFDPVLWVFAGNITDTSHFNGGNHVNLIDALDPGFMAWGDDEISHPGPFGDPWIQVTMTLPGTDIYTAIVANYSTTSDPGAYDYSITGWGIVDPPLPLSLETTSVPEPASLGLLGAGLAGIALALRRRRQSI